MMNFQPHSDYILVRPESYRVTSTLEVISREPFSRGTVVAVGPGRWLKDRRGIETFLKLTVKVGDYVLLEGDDLRSYPRWSETPLGEPYLVCQEADIACILEEDEVIRRS
jgi:co-chaperonin GroES (HSP10)